MYRADLFRLAVIYALFKFEIKINAMLKNTWMIFLCAGTLLFAGARAVAQTPTWLTTSYVIELASQCEQVQPGCNSAEMVLTRKSDGSVLRLSPLAYGDSDGTTDWVYIGQSEQQVYALDAGNAFLQVQEGDWVVLMEQAYRVNEQDIESAVFRYEILDTGWVMVYTPIAAAHGAQGCERLIYYDENGQYDGYDGGTACRYAGIDLLQAYADYRQRTLENGNGQYLKPEVSRLQDDEDRSQEEVSVTYTWAGPQKLTVELFFGGGVDTLVLIENEQGTEVRDLYSAD